MTEFSIICQFFIYLALYMLFFLVLLVFIFLFFYVFLDVLTLIFATETVYVYILNKYKLIFCYICPIMVPYIVLLIYLFIFLLLSSFCDFLDFIFTNFHFDYYGVQQLPIIEKKIPYASEVAFQKCFIKKIHHTNPILLDDFFYKEIIVDYPLYQSIPFQDISNPFEKFPFNSFIKYNIKEVNNLKLLIFAKNLEIERNLNKHDDWYISFGYCRIAYRHMLPSFKNMDNFPFVNFLVYTNVCKEIVEMCRLEDFLLNQERNQLMALQHNKVMNIKMANNVLDNMNTKVIHNIHILKDMDAGNRSRQL